MAGAMKKKVTFKLSLERQKELVAINKVLAFLVVSLALSTGLLLAMRESWFVEPAESNESVEYVPPATSSGTLSLTQPEQTDLNRLLKKARYDQEVDESLPISEEELTEIIWAAQGQITSWGERTVPSFKSSFPIDLEVFVRRVTDVSPGLYYFNAEDQQLIPLTSGAEVQWTDKNPAILDSAVVITAKPKLNTTVDASMIWQEAGGIAQNIILSVKDQNLAAVFIQADSWENSLWHIAISYPINTAQ